MIGTTLGHYRITAKLGEGGMGVVYRAHDERLDRDVAIKVLHEAVAQDADRLARFEREAKAVAKLDHPNILAIHELGTHQGAPFIVTELLDGQSLRQCIPASGMPWQKVVETGAAIADGLAAAHGKGIVHRDLKPENVFVTSDGRVKILDFGLAQVKVPVEEEAETATMTPAGTVAGTVMGTMGYMSPEQLRGEPSDARSDIFALGCVLHEMLSGQTAFLRNSTAETTAAILKEEPPSLSESGTTLPAELDRTIRRCLEKSPEARFQSAADLAYNLRSIGTGSAVPVMATSSDETPVAARSTKPAYRRYALMTSGLIIAFIATWWVLTQRGSDEPTQGSSPAFQSMTITPVTSLGTIQDVAISPDGRQLAYIRNEAGSSSIWMRQVATGSEVEVVPPLDLGIYGVEFSPDGEHVFFLHGDNRDMPNLSSMFRVPTFGGEVRRMVVDADGPPTFSPDGQRFAFRRGIPGKGTALVVADADGSGQRELAIAENLLPAWSPDGRTIGAMARVAGDLGVFAFDVDTGSHRGLSSGRFSWINGIGWLPDSEELLVSGTLQGGSGPSQIWKLSTGDGTLQRITNDPNEYLRISLSADGKVLATVLRQKVGHLFVAPADDTDSIRQLTQGSRERVWGLDADGSSVVFQRRPDGNTWQLWACDHDGNDLRRLNTDGVTLIPSAVSVAGGRVLFAARAPGKLRQIWSIDDTGNLPQQIVVTDIDAFGPSLAPDGSWFVYSLEGPWPTPGGVWRQPAGGGHPVLLDASGSDAVISPHGEHVAIRAWRMTDDEGYLTYLEVIPAAGGVPKMSVDGNRSAGLCWKPDGQAFTYLLDDQVWRQPLDGGPPQQLTHFDHNDVRTISHAWSPDGKWLYLVREEVTRDAVLIRNF